MDTSTLEQRLADAIKHLRAEAVRNPGHRYTRVEVTDDNVTLTWVPGDTAGYEIGYPRQGWAVFGYLP